MRAALMRAIYGPPFIGRASERELRSAAVKDTLLSWGASVEEEARRAACASPTEPMSAIN